MFCCGDCFDSEYLKDHIKVQTEEVGNCNLCTNQNTGLILPSKLLDLFTPLLELYCTSSESNGTSLIQLLREDWGLFKSRSDVESLRVLRLVVDDPTFQADHYQSKFASEEDITTSWGEFKQELKHSNRYFPNSFPEHDELSRLLSFLSIETAEELQTLYRARINKNFKLYPLDKMGAPPTDLATAGRANPFGISYLYVASNANTAISELRPHKGDSVTVADFHLNTRLKLIDLRSPRNTVSPFRYSDDELEMIHKKLGLLVRLGEELTKPVAQDVAHLEYLSSQYICEFIKFKGYDGVIYKSSLGDGDNYAIFNSDHLSAASVNGYKVGEIKVHFEELSGSTSSEHKKTETTLKKKGVVKWFNNSKGFGFIYCADLKCDVFVHHSNICCDGQWASLKEKDRVEFDTSDSKKGITAVKVVLTQSK